MSGVAVSVEIGDGDEAGVIDLGSIAAALGESAVAFADPGGDGSCRCLQGQIEFAVVVQVACWPDWDLPMTVSRSYKGECRFGRSREGAVAFCRESTRPLEQITSFLPSPFTSAVIRLTMGGRAALA